MSCATPQATSRCSRQTNSRWGRAVLCTVVEPESRKQPSRKSTYQLRTWRKDHISRKTLKTSREVGAIEKLTKELRALLALVLLRIPSPESVFVHFIAVPGRFDTRHLFAYILSHLLRIQSAVSPLSITTYLYRLSCLLPSSLKIPGPLSIDMFG